MIIKILGALDILSGMFFWLFVFFHIIPESIILLSSFYLIAKGIGFLISQDIISIFDILAGIIIFASLTFEMPMIVVILTTLYLIQKGIFSFL